MIRDRLILQQRELTRKLNESYVERDVLFPAGEGLIKVIIGPRRTGKSTFAIRQLQKQGKFAYCNFDDEEFVRITDYQELVTELETLYEMPHFFLFDEIQNIPRWELLVNRLQRQGYQLVITGSNAHLLSKELATHLTGRHQQIILFPFSFKEFLRKKNQHLTSYETAQEFENYLQQGGFPEPLSKELDKEDYLKTLFNNILYKDIVKRWNIRSVPSIDQLAQYFFSAIGNEFSYHSLRRVTGVKSTATIEKYLHALQEAFLFFFLTRFSFKAKERETAQKKIYCIDNGFIQAKGISFSQQRGKMYENIAAIELKKREMQGKIHFFYWKNPQQEEVDFVIKEGLKVTQLIQVCEDISNEKTKMREMRALLKASRELHCSDLLLLTREKEGTEKMEWFGMRGEVRFLPLWKWLLEGKF
ncbi:ATP-binding protein [Candidatus Woesearchaeota archaeon]|nr:ATP-binding protein [Candidatus Woesearchaeota archaeon]